MRKRPTDSDLGKRSVDHSWRLQVAEELARRDALVARLREQIVESTRSGRPAEDYLLMIEALMGRGARL